MKPFLIDLCTLKAGVVQLSEHTTLHLQQITLPDKVLKESDLCFLPLFLK